MSSREPAYIRNFKAATKREPTEADLEKLEMEMYGASDRTSVITLVSYLEWLFGRFIRALLRQTLNSEEKRILFDYNGPLGTFSSQIAIAYALGAMRELTRDDLDLLRIIRNGAAHSAQIFSFDSPETIAMCKALKIPDSESKVFSVNYIERFTGKKLELGDKFDDNSAKTRFNCSVHTISFNILQPKEPKRVVYIIPYHLP